MLCCVLASIGLSARPTAAQGPVINEVQSSNDHTLFDEEGDSPDWIELWNLGAAPYELSGCGLSDNAKRPFKWVFAPGTTIGAGEYLVVFASGKDRQPDLAPAVAPDEVEGLRVWLRADAVQILDAAQVGRAGDRTNVRLWRDLSGHGNDASAPSEQEAPQQVTVSPTGLPAVRFDGINNRLELPRPVGTNDFCIFAVYRTTLSHQSDPEQRAGVNGTRGQTWLFGATNRGDREAGAGISVGTNGVAVYEHGSVYLPALLSYRRPLGSGWQVMAVNYAGRRPSLDVQGVPVRNGLTSARRRVWAPVEIGSGQYGAFAGDLLEVLIFNRSLSGVERRGLARYLAERYSIPLRSPRHTNFHLSARGDTVVLTSRDGVTLDRVSFGAIPRDASYGRVARSSAQWNFSTKPTPGASNSTPGATDWLLPPVFSHAGGFSSNAFELTVTNPNAGGEIRFTLDGAEPVVGSALYEKPIPIGSRAGTANDLSAIPTVPDGKPPLGEVFKGWVVRARVFRTGALPSPVASRTFWVDPAGARRYTLPTVSLTTDRKNLFNPKTGIYVPGTAAGGNYAQHGPQWERAVHIEVFETNGQAILDQDGGVKIHGHTSQMAPIKGLDISARFGAQRQPFHGRLFPDRNRESFGHLLLRPSGQDYGGAFMRDELVQQLGSEVGLETQAARPCIVFLNGEYWGLHYLKEKEDAEFVSFYGKVPKNGIDYLEGFATAKAGDTEHYDALVKFLAAREPAVPANYARIQSWMELPDFIDYKVCEIFNYRWDLDNHRLWRPRTASGRWRWLQWDNDVSWGGFWTEPPAWRYDMLAAELSTDGRLHGHNNEPATLLLRRLLLNPEFQRDFINRFADLLNTVYRPAHTIAVVDRLASQLAQEMADHCDRWRAPASRAQWQRAVDQLREYARRRPDFCRQHLMRRFKLPGTAQLSLRVQPPGSGSIHLNTIDASPAGEAPWVGVYFQGNPVQLTARPQPGWRFAAWDGLTGAQTNSVELLLKGDRALTARFETSRAKTSDSSSAP